MLVFRPTETRHLHAATLPDANATIENPKKDARTTTHHPRHRHTARIPDATTTTPRSPPRIYAQRCTTTRTTGDTAHRYEHPRHAGTCTAPHIHDPRAPAPRHTSRYGQQSPRHASRSTSVQHDTHQRIDHQTTRTTSHPLPPQYKQGNREPPRPQ